LKWLEKEEREEKKSIESRIAGQEVLLINFSCSLLGSFSAEIVPQL